MPIVFAKPVIIPVPVWNLSNAAAAGTSVSLENSPVTGMAFKPDGTKMYVCDGGAGYTSQYTLSTPWDVTTALYASLFKDHSAENITPFAISFKSDGSKLYMLGISGSNTIYQYTLSTPWKIDTASYDNVSYVPTLADVSGFELSDDGTKLYLLDDATDTINRYSLTTPWSIAAVTDDSNSKLILAQDGTIRDIFFKPDGITMFMVGSGTNTVYQYTLGTAWDTSGAVYDSISLDLSLIESASGAIALNTNGTRIYILGGGGDVVYQYNLNP